MGEMLLKHHKDEVPLVIIRPSMVTGTSKDPFPGWIEGLRYTSHMILNYKVGVCSSSDRSIS